MICTFFGHRDCPSTVREKLKKTIESVVKNYGVNLFYVGNSGQFDVYCRSVLKELGVKYAVVLSQLPKRANAGEDFSDTILPEGLADGGPPRFAIDRRNRWLVDQSQIVICYVRQKRFGGAAKFVTLAEKKGKRIINLYSSEEEQKLPPNCH